MNPRHVEALMARAANYAKSQIVPAAYRDKPDDVFVAMELALRLGCEPLMVMQKVYVIAGKPAFETQFAAALLADSNLTIGPPSWVLSQPGQKNPWCTCSVIDRETKRTLTHTLHWSTVVKEGWLSKKGSKWATDPQLMLQYRSLMRLIRLFYPLVLFGMYSKDEIEEMAIDSTTVFDTDEDKHRAEQDARAVLDGQLAESPLPKADEPPSDEEMNEVEQQLCATHGNAAEE